METTNEMHEYEGIDEVNAGIYKQTIDFTATNTIIDTVQIKTLALLSFFTSDGCNINIVVLIFYFD